MILAFRKAAGWDKMFMSSGWAVNVRARMSDKIEASETYYARVSDRQAAEEAVRRYLNAPTHIIEARLPVQSSVFDALKIRNDQVDLRAAKHGGQN